MTTPLAWKNLLHNRLRTVVGVLGVGFAVVLIFMQLGFRGAIERTATQIFESLDFDLLIRSPAYIRLTDPRSVPRGWLYQAGSLPEVEWVRPLDIGLSEWQAPYPKEGRRTDATDDDVAGLSRGIIVLGINPEDPPFVPKDYAAINDAATALTDSRFVLMDTKTKPEFGPQNGRRFGEEDIGVETVLGTGRVQIVGLYELGAGMACNGSCMTNHDGFRRACPWQQGDQASFGLVKLADTQHADPQRTERVRDAIAGLLPVSRVSRSSDAEPERVVLTREEVFEQERRQWLDDTPFGQILTLGVVIAVLVGVAVVYQVLSNDIGNMISEYATLKAMGYSDTYLTTIVLQQAVLLAVFGFLPSLAVAFGLYALVEWYAGIPMKMTWDIALFVLVLAVGICIASGIAALRKLYQAEPADLF
ncbi:FtsX-like permease family protein [Pirellulimonas nuda]|uniref:FtsX-like permease family protein n=1 Tax=Pirellulimonas nuda TaxID=2528009 RepID=A0A518D8A0_9BACT|nr:FtsX-like permease family protein [Pirellulimonas nuda]QDU87706.1 FtsX-like permease family protein [Pirellulimonas nuda]